MPRSWLDRLTLAAFASGAILLGVAVALTFPRYSGQNHPGWLILCLPGGALLSVGGLLSLAARRRFGETRAATAARVLAVWIGLGSIAVEAARLSHHRALRLVALPAILGLGLWFWWTSVVGTGQLLRRQRLTVFKRTPRPGVALAGAWMFALCSIYAVLWAVGAVHTGNLTGR